MFLFGRKRFDTKAEKLRLIRRTEQLQERTLSHGLHRVTVALDKVVNLLDDKYLGIRKEQAVLLDTFLSDIDSHLSKQYETLLLKKCDHITSILRGDSAIDEKIVTKIKNEDRLFEMLGELGLIDEELKDLDKRMEAALGTDKNLWNMLNAQRRTLASRMMVINKNYQTLLESQNAISVASEVKKAREEAEDILRQTGMQDILEFEENAEFTTMTADEIRESSERMQEVLAKTFGGTVDSYEYERALEAKLIENEAPVARKRKSPAAENHE